MPDLWPVTIIQTRYGGAYENGGEWAAVGLCLGDNDMPLGIIGGDPECDSWWGAFGHHCGVGKTPDEALAALMKIEEKERILPRAAWGDWPYK